MSLRISLLLSTLLLGCSIKATEAWLSSYPSPSLKSLHPKRSQAGSASSTVALHQSYWQEFDTKLEGIDESFAEQQWYLPSIVERALIDQDTTVNPHQLLQALDMSGKTRNAALEALTNDNGSVKTFPNILNRDECYTLQNYLWKHVEEECGIDDTDQCADWQVNLEEETLIKLIGEESVQRLYQIPSRFELESNPSPPSFERVGIFLRVYERSEQGRPWMPFHSDGNSYTVNIALNNDDEFEGGRLLALADNSLKVLTREQGDATCHSGSLYHAVSAMKRGIRYSMILFFHSDTSTESSYE